MSSISQVLSQLPELKNLFQSPSFTASTNQIQAHVQTSTHTNFNFVTAEGDRVTLSNNSEANTSLGTYSFQGLTERQGISLQSQQFSKSIQQNFNLFIEGDLNEQELADIQKFLKSAKRIVQELGAGDIEKAAKTTASLSNLDSLAQAALFVRKSTSISLASQSTRLSLQEEAGTDKSTRASGSPRLKGTDTLDHMFNKIREAQETFHLNPEQLLIRLPKLATKIIDSLRQDKDISDPPTPIFKDIQKEFLESLLESIKEVSRQKEHNDTLPKDTKPATTVTPVIGKHIPDPSSSPAETIEETTKP